jgi:ATP-dependent protease ClpP protease subunit
VKRLISLILTGCLLVVPFSVSAKIERVATTEEATEIFVEGSITEASLMEFLKATAYSNDKHFNITIMSNGGDAYSTIGIIHRINELKDKGCTFTTRVYSKALSAAAYIFLMGDEREIYEGATLMFHTMVQQVSEARREAGRAASQNTAVQIAMVERMDKFIRARFNEVANCGPETADYFLNGSKDESTKMQFMSGLTAFNLNIATKYIKY